MERVSIRVARPDVHRDGFANIRAGNEVQVARYCPLFFFFELIWVHLLSILLVQVLNTKVAGKTNKGHFSSNNMDQSTHLIM